MTARVREAAGISSAAGVVDVSNADGGGDVILVCEHASKFIPPEFGGLGLPQEALDSHIAWDSGALPVAAVMSAALDAPLVAHGVSRLVFDCNRDPDSADAVLETSEIHTIPGNRGLSAAERRQRANRYYAPFHDTLAACIEKRAVDGRPVIVTIHSFAPVYDGQRREFDLGILHDRDSRLADACLAVLGADGGLDVRHNQPYGPQDGVTHTLIRHALGRGLLNVMIEIRNDLIASPSDQRAMSETLSVGLVEALADLASGRLVPENGGGPGASDALPKDRVETA